MHRTQAVALVRALAAASWADGRLERSEESYLKTLAYRLGLDHDDLHREVLPLLEQPVSYDQAMTILGELAGVLGSAGERQMFLDALHGLFEVDGTVTDEERELMEVIEEGLARYGTVDFLIGRFRGLLRGIAPRHGRGAARRTGSAGRGPAALGAYAQNRLLPRVLERLDERLDDDALARLNRATLEGAVLTRVATAGGRDLDDAAVAVIRERLLEGLGLDADASAAVVEMLVEGPGEAMDRQRLCAELNRVTTADERLELIDTLFTVALAAGDGTGAAATTPSRERRAEIRLLANFLWVPTRAFVAVRARRLEGRTGRPAPGD